MSVILNFVTGVYTINGQSRTLAQCIEADPGDPDTAFSYSHIIPGIGWKSPTPPPGVPGFVNSVGALTAEAFAAATGGNPAGGIVINVTGDLDLINPSHADTSVSVDVNLVNSGSGSDPFSSLSAYLDLSFAGNISWVGQEVFADPPTFNGQTVPMLATDGVHVGSFILSPTVTSGSIDGGVTVSSNPAHVPINPPFMIRIWPRGAGGTANINESTVTIKQLTITPIAPVITDLDANPAHMIYECLTNRDWGMGSPTTMIDTAAFEAAGVTLYAEGLGLSMLWLRQDTIENFVSEIIDHIQATVFVNPRTGLITIKLIRGDYDPLTLRTITPDTADLTNFQRKAWGEIVNEVVVTWTNPVTEQDETVVAQDLGAIAAQNGAIISDNRNYYGVRSAAVATRLAARDLRSAAAPMATCEVTLDRTAWNLLPGEVVKLTWPEYGFDGVAMRVGAVDYGKPGESLIRANLIEDIFGLAAGDYVTPPVSQWQGIDAPPGPADFSRVITVPAFFAAKFLAGAGDTSTFNYPEVIAGVLASDADAYNYDLFGPTVLVDGSTVQERQSTNTVLGRGTTVAALPLAASTSGVTFAGLIGAVDPAQTIFVLIGGDGTAESAMEIALITASAGGVHTLARGLLDTVPREWAAGTVIWLLDTTSTISDLDPKADGETVTYRLLTRSFGGLLSYADAPVLSGTLSGRPHYPNRPANVTAHGAAWSSAAAIIDARARVNPWVTATWANRNRLMEDSQVLLWTGATVTPEVGQTARIEVCTADGTVLTTHAGLTGTSFNVPDASFAGEAVVRLRIWAARTDSFGSFNSLQYFEHWVRVAPLRFDSTRVTFDSTLWTMDQG